MNLEGKIKNCKYNLDQIKHYNPEPFYVNYFLSGYIKSIIEAYDGIFEEANRDFGLFVSGKSTKEKFERKANEKKDQFALKFLSWFDENYKNEHETSYPNFINNIIFYFKTNSCIPKITIKMLSNQRYEHDIIQQINVGFKGEKLRSRQELQIEVMRQIPGFLELINRKRKDRDEPSVHEGQVIVSTFLELESYEEMEIPYACEVYLPVLKRILDESRIKIKQLTQ